MTEIHKQIQKTGRKGAPEARRKYREKKTDPGLSKHGKTMTNITDNAALIKVEEIMLPNLFLRLSIVRLNPD